MNIPLKAYWNLLGDYLLHQRGRFFLLSALLLGGIGLQILNPQVVRYFIDAATTGQALSSLVLAGLAFVVSTLLQQGIAIGATYVGENMAWIATNALRETLARHCLHLDMRFHNEHTPGELIERIDGDVTELATFFSQLVVQILGNLLLLGGVLLVLYLEDWRLGLSFSGFAALTLFVLNGLRGLAIAQQKALREARAKLFGFLEERLSGTEDICASGAVDFVLCQLYRHMYNIMGQDRQAEQRQSILYGVSNVLLALGNVTAFGLGYLLFRQGSVTIGAVYVIIQYINLLGRPLREISRQVQSLQRIGAGVTRLEELLNLTPTLADGPGAELAGGPLALDLKSIHFGYKQEEPVLQNVSFRLEPGQTLGLLGRTGSGKTTLARLILRLYDPQEGQILLNGTNIRQPHLDQLRQRVAMVTQDVQLFQGSVRDNLTFFDRSISDAQIQAVIEELGLSDWYGSLPRGLDTLLGEGERGLSAGEAQLLAFTRIFLRNPGLVILDEASSRLDPITEQRIEQAVDKLLQDRTAIIIAHRLRTVQRADQIMILEEGRVVEHDQRERLVQHPHSRFSKLLQSGLEEVLA
ncbi:MAG: ABC transporter ATP-binding protein [Chloroflexia bacterium]|nr:ABC transporter ATP-binding protein [Chloroflexia bacterium]